MMLVSHCSRTFYMTETIYQFLPQRRNCPHDVRDRTHDRELIQQETGLEKEFITRMLFKDSKYQILASSYVTSFNFML